MKTTYILLVLLLVGCTPDEPRFVDRWRGAEKQHGTVFEQLEVEAKARHINEIARCHRLGMAYYFYAAVDDVEVQCIEYPNEETTGDLP